MTVLSQQQRELRCRGAGDVRHTEGEVSAAGIHGVGVEWAGRRGISRSRDSGHFTICKLGHRALSRCPCGLQHVGFPLHRPLFFFNQTS